MIATAFVKISSIAYKFSFCGSWMKCFGLFILFFIGQLHAQVSVDDFRLATRLELSSVDKSKLVLVGEGTFFEYYRFTDNPGRGVLVPTRDQSFLTRHSVNFGSRIIDGRIASDAASGIFDKVDQLFALKRFRGPEVLGLAEVDEFGDRYLAIIVENVNGSQPRLDSESSVRDEYINLFLEMTDAGFIPLDYTLGNVRFVDEASVLRPIDVMLRTNADFLFRDSERPALRNFRLLQWGRTIVSVEHEFPSEHPGIDVCRKLISSMRQVIPEIDKYVPSILRERQLQLVQP